MTYFRAKNSDGLTGFNRDLICLLGQWKTILVLVVLFKISGCVSEYNRTHPDPENDRIWEMEMAHHGE